MSYINDRGFTIGPLQIQSSGTWLTHSVEDEIESIIGETQNIIQTKYLAFSKTRTVDSENVKLVPLMAGTPLCGTYPSGNGNRPFCDINAVATVGWVMTYATLAPGQQSLDLDDIIYRKEFNDLALRVLKNEELIDAIQRTLNSYDSRIAINKQNIDKNTERIIVLEDSLANDEVILEDHEDRLSIVEQWQTDFNDGCILIGWDKELGPSGSWGE